MQPTSHDFPQNARAGLANPVLQRALGLARTGFPARRAQAVARLPEFEALREEGRAIKDHTLAHLDFYLELYERNVIAAGGKVHWARTAGEARAAVLDICRSVGAKIVTKGKSMVAEEIALNDHLEANGITPVETDLGEYIIQLRHEPPSHIIAPAIHLMKEQVADAFREAHTELDPARPLVDPRALCDEARTVLRPRFLSAEGWFPPGAVGGVLCPALVCLGEAGHLPTASPFCGRCESVCPVKIPLPKRMRQWREREFAWRLNPPVYRSGLRLWAAVAQRPALYHALAGTASRVLGWAGQLRGRFRSLPFAAGWTAVRDMPAPQGRSFQSLWTEQQRRSERRR